MVKSKLVDEIGYFTAFPNWAIEMGEEIGTDGLVLLLALRYQSGEKRLIFPSYDTLQKHTGLNRHQIARAIRKLEELKIVERKKRFGQSTIYSLKNLLAPTSSAESALMEEEPPVVQNMHQSSADSALSVVPNMHTNKTNLTTSIKQEEKEDDVIDEPSEEEAADFLRKLATEYERTFGTLMTPAQGDILKDWCETYPQDWVMEALQKTAMNNGRTLGYTQRILYDMQKNGKNGRHKRDKARQMRDIAAPVRDGNWYTGGEYGEHVEH